MANTTETKWENSASEQRDDLSTSARTKPTISPENALEALLSLKDKDPAQFVRIVERLSEEAKSIADTLTGADHPLRKVMGRRRNDPSIETLLENIREAREARISS